MMRSIFQRRHCVLSRCLTQTRLHLHLCNLCSKTTHFDISQTDLHNNLFHIESLKFRNTLYPDSNDTILNQLKSCNSVQQVFDIFAANQQNLSSQHLCQTILILRDIQKVFNRYYLNDFSNSPSQQRYDTGIHQSNHSVFQVFQVDLIKHEVFGQLLNEISVQCTKFNIDEAVCMILYLRYLGLGLRHDTIQRLISHAGKMLKNSADTPLSYQTLSRYFSVFKFDESLYSVLHLSQILPIVIAHLERCTDIYSLGQISVCLEVVSDLMNSQLRCSYRERLEHLLPDLSICSLEDTRSLMKILLFLNETFWNEENVLLIRRILLLMSDAVHLLDIKEIIHLQRVFSTQLEPYLFLDRVQKRAEFVMSRCDDVRGEPSLGTLVCMAPVASYKQKKYIEKILLSKLREPGSILNTMSTLATIADLIRLLQSDNNQIHLLFWERVMVLLQDEPNISFLMFFTTRYIKRYLYHSDIRNPRFEEFASQNLWKEIEYAGPILLAQYSAAILKFNPAFVRSRIPELLFDKLINNVAQMSLLPCFELMDALSCMVTHLPLQNRKISPQFSLQFTQLERRLESRINQILDEADTISVTDWFEIFLKRKCKHWHHIYEKLYSKIPPESVTSKIIYAACRHIVYSEQYSSTHALLNKCVTYCESNLDAIIGFVVSYVLYTSYLCSYPLHAKHPAFLDTASSILLRDKDSLKALLMIRATLSLAYFNALPYQLASHIFSLTFLEYLDEEMTNKTTQSITLKIRSDLMELNRAVCLDYAQFGIPWFHQKYAGQVALSDSSRSSERQFSSDVHRVLLNYVGDRDRVMANCVSPYGQKIDFVLHLDKLGNPIATRDPTRIQTRLAILLEHKSAEGPSDLKRRHLELQGYCVVRLHRKEWNSLFMGEPRAKDVFLDQIFSQYRPMLAPGDTF